MSAIDNVLNYLGYSKSKTIESSDNKVLPDNVVDKETTKPAGRVSISENQSINDKLKSLGAGFIKPDFNLELIPVIRRLTKNNEDVGSVYYDLIQLTNTGFEIKFDQSIKPELQDKMRKHLEEKQKNWGSGVSGINGLINKWIGQIWISGALSNEWVVAKDFSGILNNVIVNPENIVFKYDYITTRYKTFQLVKNQLLTNHSNLLNAVELNNNTFFYEGIINDTDTPYGIPPFITAIEALSTQKTMKKNINHILKQLGLLGYLEVKLDKPSQTGGESLPSYNKRLDQLLIDSKKNVIEGFSDGVVVGYDGDHEFKFHATAKQLSGVSDLYNQNEVQIANGLKTSPSFLGQKSNGTETNMSIVFTKMLSQLKSVQNILSANLIKGYTLELSLAGYDIKSSDMSVVFNTSTITDDLKLWQGKEIKQRVLKFLFIDGIIGKDGYAEGMGFKKPFSDKPVIPYDEQQGGGTQTEPGLPKQKRNEIKKKSDRKNRDKNKKQPRRKDGETKPR